MPFPITPDVAMAAYLGFCILLAVIVYSFRIFDRRELATVLDDELRPLSFFERPDRGLLILVFGAIGLLLAAYLGWQFPSQIQRYMDGGTIQSLLPDMAEGVLGRAAQVVGATTFFLIALRLLRLSLIFAFALTILALAVAAYAYVFA